MSNSSTSFSLISVKFQLGDKQEVVQVFENKIFEKELLKFTEGQVFGICYGVDQMFIPIEINMVAKRSSQDSSVSSIFYFDKEIISTKESPLTIKLKRISKHFHFNHYYIMYHFIIFLQVLG